jgi:hypothetical protein
MYSHVCPRTLTGQGYGGHLYSQWHRAGMNQTSIFNRKSSLSIGVLSLSWDGGPHTYSG